MSSVNKTILIGRLGADPERRSMPDGTAVCNFSLATSSISNKNGERKEFTEWHKCSAFNKAAEIAGEYLKKGSLAYVDGRLRTRRWKNKEGIEISTTELVGNSLTLLERAPKVKDPLAAVSHPPGESPADDGFLDFPDPPF